MSRLRQLIHEIHRRSLWQVLGIYVVGSWFVLQVVDTMVGALRLPDWAPPLALSLVIIGLPIVMATAFIQEGARPEASRETGQGPGRGLPEASARRQLFTWRNAILGGVGAFAIWGLVAAGWILLAGAPSGLGRAEEPMPSVAALPFQNISGDPEDIYFTDGIHEEILTQLAKISGLRVISRTSVMEYRSSPKNVRDVASELGVGHVLEGSVRKTGNRVRISAQLIDAARDQHLWAEQYDRELTAEDLFEIQGDVAQKIAAALQTELSPEETQRIEARPTSSLEAYEYFLRGNQLSNQGWLREDILGAIEMWEKAVSLDPEFAVAHAALSRAHSQMWWFHLDRSQARLDLAKAAVDRALEIQHDLPQALAALGWYHYHGHLDYARALEAFEAAREGLPGAPDVPYGVAAVQRRQGDMEASIANYKRALELDPRSAVLASQVGETYGLLRRFEEARPYLDQAIALSPEFGSPYYDKAIQYVGSGDTERARQVFAEGAERGVFPSYSWAWIWLETLDGRFQAALSGLRERPADVPRVGDPGSLETQFRVATANVWYGTLYGLLGDSARARSHWDSARVGLEGRVAAEPEDSRLHSALGIAYASLGWKEEAVRQGRLGVALMPMNMEAYRGAYRVEDLARIYATVGEPDAAIDELEFLLSRPGVMTVGRLRLEPWWKPLHGHSRFEALLSRRELEAP